MAKNSSLFKVEGTLDEVTFYKRNGLHFVKTKSKVSRDRILKDPSFARTRENMSEFGTAAQAGKLMRHSLGYLLERVQDSRMTGRLTGIMARVKQEDTVSDRGKRQVVIGINTDTGKSFLNGFDFNQNAPLSLVLKHSYSLDEVTGGVSITELIPSKHVRFTEGATHVSFSCAALRVDFDKGDYLMQHSDEQVLPINNESQDVSIAPASLPEGTGSLFYLLLIEFYQEFNGKLYSLNNGGFNVLHILSLT